MNSDDHEATLPGHKAPPKGEIPIFLGSPLCVLCQSSIKFDQTTHRQS